MDSIRIVAPWIAALFGGVDRRAGGDRGQAKVETWRQEGPTAFAKAHREGVVVSDTGRIRLGHALAPLGTIGVERVWDLARTREGILLAATGDGGKVMGREPKAGANWSVVYDCSSGQRRLFEGGDTQVLSLVVTPEGISYAGTGPSGQVVNLTDPKHPVSRPDPKVQYIWDLACDQQGNLLAATGPNGQLWKRSTQGQWSLLVRQQVDAFALPGGGAGRVDLRRQRWRGVDLPGVARRQGDDRLRRPAIRDSHAALGWRRSTLCGHGGGSRRWKLGQELDVPGAGRVTPASGRAPSGGDGSFPPGGADTDTQVKKAATQPGPPGGAGQTRPATPSRPGGSAAPRPITAGDNAVYRLDADGVPREVLRFKALVHALAWANDRLIVGTGPDGVLFEIREAGHETAPIAKLDSGQILSLLAEPDGTLLLGTGDPGTVVRLAPGYAPSGSLVSEIHDTKLVSRFGVLSWRADRPADTSVTFQSRSGNVGEPDETWSAWSAEQNDPAKALDGLSGRTVHPVSRPAFHE